MADPEKVPSYIAVGAGDAGKTTESAVPTKEPQVAPGFKIVKVRMPDGTIKKVKRPAAPAPAAVEKQPVQSNGGVATNEPAKVVTTPVKKDGATPTAEKASTTIQVATNKASEPAGSPVQATPVASGPKTTSTAPRASPVTTPAQTQQRMSRSFFSAFAARAITALAPAIGDIGELLDGDEIIDEGYDSDDFDDDESDRNGHDTDNAQHGGTSESHQQLQNTAAMAGVTGLAAGLAAQPPAYAAPNGAKSGVQVSEKAEVQLNEKGASNHVKPGDPETRSLRKAHSDWTRYVIWFIMLTFPILFIVLGVLTAVLPMKEFGGQYSVGLAQATKVAVSAWPIIFAAIAAQSLRTIASYKVERGIRLMTLEQLMGSNSVASSIKQPFLLMRFDLVTIALLCLWSLSPLATQALQRMSYPTSIDKSQNTTVYYLDTWSSNRLFQHDAEKQEYLDYQNVIAQFFDASVLPPGQYQNVYQDPWLRPKIPIIEYLNDSQLDSEGWTHPPILSTNSTKKTAYSSHYGIPLEEMGISGTYQFIMSSSYLHFSCSDLKQGASHEWNTTGLRYRQFTSNQTDATVYLSIMPQNETDPGHVMYANSLGNEEYLYSLCDFSQTFVDSMMNCYSVVASTQDYSNADYKPSNSECLVEKIRKTPSPPAKSAMGDFTPSFIGAAENLLQGYLYDPSNITSLLGSGTFDLRSLTTEEFTKRLGVLINTYWQLGFGPTVQDSGLSHLTSSVYLATVAKSIAIVGTPMDAYAVSWGWIVALFICSGILLVASIVSMIMDARTIVPDMLGFASSLARKSRYVDLPKVNSSMSGSERARLLRDQIVMMQDVKPNAPVGRVALGSAHSTAKRLEKGRQYR